LAWHIAHQPFGVIAGAKQYKHAKNTVFEGYAGGSESGFAAEVAAEEAVALLDYAEDLYRDWNGHHEGRKPRRRPAPPRTRGHDSRLRPPHPSAHIA
jgi:hypothetical protein